MPVAVELNGLLPGLGPGRGPLGRGPDPPGLGAPGLGAPGPEGREVAGRATRSLGLLVRPAYGATWTLTRRTCLARRAAGWRDGSARSLVP